jgi:hypothetical protein
MSTLDELIPNSDMPEGTCADWKIERFTVTEKDARWENLHNAIHGIRDWDINPGVYTRLVCGKSVVMSDTPGEKRSHLPAIRHAQGHVLVNGLGLGLIVSAMFKKPEVKKITVIEISPWVITLVKPTLTANFGDRVEIIEADAFAWKPPKGIRYGAVWNDIWNSICTDNWEDMSALQRKYSRRADWVGCWSMSEVKTARRREKSYYAAWR